MEFSVSKLKILSFVQFEGISREIEVRDEILAQIEQRIVIFAAILGIFKQKTSRKSLNTIFG